MRRARIRRSTCCACSGPDRLIDPTSISDVWNYGEDPARYPIDTGRLRRTIEAGAKGIGWGRKMEKGTGLGLAGHYSFGHPHGGGGGSRVGPKVEVQVKRSTSPSIAGRR